MWGLHLNHFFAVLHFGCITKCKSAAARLLAEVGWWFGGKVMSDLNHVLALICFTRYYHNRQHLFFSRPRLAFYTKERQDFVFNVSSNRTRQDKCMIDVSVERKLKPTAAATQITFALVSCHNISCIFLNCNKATVWFVSILKWQLQNHFFTFWLAPRLSTLRPPHWPGIEAFNLSLLGRCALTRGCRAGNQS